MVDRDFTAVRASYPRSLPLRCVPAGAAADSGASSPVRSPRSRKRSAASGSDEFRDSRRPVSPLWCLAGRGAGLADGGLPSSASRVGAEEQARWWLVRLGYLQVATLAGSPTGPVEFPAIRSAIVPIRRVRMHACASATFPSEMREFGRARRCGRGARDPYLPTRRGRARSVASGALPHSDRSMRQRSRRRRRRVARAGSRPSAYKFSSRRAPRHRRCCIHEERHFRPRLPRLDQTDSHAAPTAVQVPVRVC